MNCSKSGCGSCGNNGASYIKTYHGKKTLTYDDNKDLIADVSKIEALDVNLSNCCAPLLVFDANELIELVSKPVENTIITLTNPSTIYTIGIDWTTIDDADVDPIFPSSVYLCGGTKVTFDVGTTNYLVPNYKIIATFYKSDDVTIAGTIDFNANLSGLTASLTQVTFTSSVSYISIPDVATGKNPTLVKIVALPTIQRTNDTTTTLLTPLKVQCISNVVTNFLTCDVDDCPC